MAAYLLIAAGGVLGALARYMTATTAASKWGTFFPYGTLIVNVIGCFLVGYLVLKGIEGALSPNLRFFLVVGFGGAFTTFSSFSAETLLLLRDGLYTYALLNVGLNLVLCLGASFLGFMLAKAL
ncbi:camphor resistance protein CrcB [Thermosyntropha lipolytica DSM 11003]|uniref:Fluoride-specific ion channel FluC n=1 Tax=Thermosyntropha lipolytica DSM 11003 TaxID=1123382 RepID=A0A1M5RIY6_9FIRM|nr:fluoride efflux transporter CrcB [Thermosyntropha lipolytica]SHH26287.1 camphor resistance protein CrcB [Thermosyntropha lipolytica DSM 11003]